MNTEAQETAMEYIKYDDLYRSFNDTVYFNQGMMGASSPSKKTGAPAGAQK